MSVRTWSGVVRGGALLVVGVCLGAVGSGFIGLSGGERAQEIPCPLALQRIKEVELIEVTVNLEPVEGIDSVLRFRVPDHHVIPLLNLFVPCERTSDSAEHLIEYGHLLCKCNDGDVQSLRLFYAGKEALLCGDETAVYVRSGKRQPIRETFGEEVFYYDENGLLFEHLRALYEVSENQKPFYGTPFQRLLESMGRIPINAPEN